MEKESAAEIVMNEMIKNMNFYMNFHEELQNKSFQLLQQADLWLNGKKYTIPVGDVCIAATANGLGMNLYIFEKIGKKAVIIQHRCTFQETNKSLFLCYTHTLQTQIILLTTTMLSSTVTYHSCHYLQQHQQHLQMSPVNQKLLKYTPPNITEQKYTPQSNEVINLLMTLMMMTLILKLLRMKTKEEIQREGSEELPKFRPFQ